MLTHKQVWDGIDKLAAKYQLSASGLAKRSGLDPTTFNKSKRITKQGKPRWPSTESVSKVLEATGATMGEFVQLMQGSAVETTNSSSTRLKSLTLSQLGSTSALDSSGFPIGTSWEEIDYPLGEDEHTFAIELDREASVPNCRTGDLLLVSPSSSVRRADRVIVRLHDGTFLFGVLARKTSQKMVIVEYESSASERVIATEEIQWMARIISITQ